MSDRRAELRSCIRDDAVVRRKVDGSVFNDYVVTIVYDVVLVFDDDRWKVQEEVVLNRTEGEASCAE